MIPSKAEHVEDVVQKVRPTQIYLLITGEARSAYGPVNIPPPLQYEGTTLLSSEFSNDAPVAGALFTAQWRYILKLPYRALNYMYVPYTPLVDPEAYDNWIQPVPQLWTDETLKKMLP